MTTNDSVIYGYFGKSNESTSVSGLATIQEKFKPIQVDWRKYSLKAHFVVTNMLYKQFSFYLNATHFAQMKLNEIFF